MEPIYPKEPRPFTAGGECADCGDVQEEDAPRYLAEATEGGVCRACALAIQEHALAHGILWRCECGAVADETDDECPSCRRPHPSLWRCVCGYLNSDEEDACWGCDADRPREGR